MKDDEKHNLGSPKHGAYGFGVRAQVIEVIVRQALAGAEWQKICAKPMQVNNITVEEIEAEVRMRRSRAPSRSFIETIIQKLFSIFPWMRKDSSDSKAAEVSPPISPPENVDEDGYVKPPRAQIFDVIVRQALAGVPWREICEEPMKAFNITPEEVEEEVKRLKGPMPPPPENKDAKIDFTPGAGSYGLGVRAQVFEVIVRQALAGAPWRQICAGPMQVNSITPEEIEEEVEKRRGGGGTSFAAVPKKPKPSQGEGEISLPLPPPENEDES